MDSAVGGQRVENGQHKRHWRWEYQGRVITGMAISKRAFLTMVKEALGLEKLPKRAVIEEVF